MRTTHFSLEGFNDSPALSGEQLQQRYAQYENEHLAGGGPFTRDNASTSGQCRQQEVQNSSLTVWDETSRFLINVIPKRGRQGHHTLSTVPLPHLTSRPHLQGNWLVSRQETLGDWFPQPVNQPPPKFIFVNTFSGILTHSWRVRN